MGDEVLQVDWETLFKPREVFGRPLRVVEHDRRMRVLPEEFALKRVALFFNEVRMLGEELLERQKKRRMCVRLGAPLWLAFKEMTSPIDSIKPKRPIVFPEHWKRDAAGHPLVIRFDGTILADPRGHRYGLFVASAGGHLVCGTYWMRHPRLATDMSAIVQR